MPEDAAPPVTPRRFTFVSAVYNVEKYLADFITSVEAQDYPLDRVQVVMVDDGSTDSSPQLLADWQRRRPELVTVVSQANGGAASARNTGLAHAVGEWVSFPDPDDLVAPDYLSEVEAALRATPDVGMVATKRTTFHEADDRLEPHALARHFAAPSRMLDLEVHPEFFHHASNSAFFRRDAVERAGLRFDERIRPHFEDSHFCIRYLLQLPRPTVAFVSSAHYTYRKRADGSSLIDGCRTHPGRYTTVMEHGYLDVLERARALHGVVPDWLQSLILYELSWYFRDDAAGHRPTAARGAVAEELHRHLGRIAGLLDPGMIRSFELRPLTPEWRDVLLHAYDEEPWHPDFVLIDKLDTWKQLVRLTYRYTHARPVEDFSSNGVPVTPAYEKTRSVNYFDRAVLHERIVWLPAGTIRARLGGVRVDVRVREPERPRASLPSWFVRETFDPRLAAEKREQARAAARRQPQPFSDRLLVRLSRTRLVRRWFADAWVLMDRIDDAGDNGEILFRWIREHRRKVNAWFVIRGGTPDHRRLRAAGYKRIVPHGTLRWKLLMLNCRHLISSHADAPVLRPPAITRLGQPEWRFTFLQHGVTKDDLSRWLNPKDLDLIVTSTPAEHESIVAEGSPYRYTDKEARLTGMPRLDALRAAGARVPSEDTNLLLLAPTWRNWLVEPGSEGRTGPIAATAFAATEFATSWLGLARSRELEELADARGLRVALLLHPNLQPLAGQLDLPAHVELKSFEGQDVRETFARARVLVTDYSSMAFDAAYLERPVVYFQFDRDLVFSGAHSGRPGYFDYERDGYGPVATVLEDAVQAIVDTVESGPRPRPEYAARIAEAFPHRDGQCTKRVFQAIRDSTRATGP